MNKTRKQTIIALICAIAAALLLFAYTATISSQAQTERQDAIDEYGGKTAKVLIATEDIGAGEKIGENNTKMETWLVDLLPGGTVARSLKTVEGQVAAVDIQKNEPILVERTGNGSARISVPAALEAVSVSSDDVLAVGGAIQPGAFVDVYVESNSGKIALLGQDILVLETNTTSSDDEASVAWVTLAITPSSVSELIAASAKGTVHLALPGAGVSRKES